MFFASVEWSEDAERGLRTALANDLSFIRHQVENGIANLWQIHHESAESWMVVRIEGNELVVVAYEGTHLQDVAPHIIRAAQKINCDSIRFHTQRPGLIRLLKEYNPEPLEYVMKINIRKVM